MMIEKNSRLYGAPKASTTKQPPRRPGVAALEFAILAPLFMFIIVGMFEMTRIIQVKQALDYASRKGCRAGIIPGQGTSYPTTGTTSSCIYKDVADILTENKLDITKATLTVTVGSAAETNYSLGGSSPNYSISKTDGSGADPISATSGTNVVVKIGLPVSSFSWLPSYFTAGSTVMSEQITMAKQ